MHLLVVGGSDAGIAAALRARELDDGADITVLVADGYPNFSICGLPFLLSGEVEDWRDLAHRSAEELERQGVRLELETRAIAVDPVRREVRAVRGDSFGYDALVVATGAEPARPPLPGSISRGSSRSTRWTTRSPSSVTSTSAPRVRR